MADASRSVLVPAMLHLRAGAVDHVGEVVAVAGLDDDRTIVVQGPGPSAPYGARVTKSVDGEVTTWTTAEGTVREAAKLAAHAIEEEARLIVGVGGGRVIDVAKLAAARTGVPFVSVPTTLSSDGISSPVASLEDKRGRRVSLGARMPAAVIVDLDVVADAPALHIAAGTGDLASNLVATADWRLADERGEEAYDEFAALIAEAAANAVWEFPTVDASMRVALLARGLVLSGLAMATAGSSRPCSGGEHLVSHALDTILGDRALPHGCQVALGTLLLADPHGFDQGRLRRVFESCGLPASAAEAGIAPATFVEALGLGPSMRPGRYTIIDDLLRDGVDLAALVERTLGH